jgi:hypothetical protein
LSTPANCAQFASLFKSRSFVLRAKINSAISHRPI